jgi:tetratricopeptide (TPR) repeat protein
MEDLEQRLQHPRRHLGDRHLAQARKFLKLAIRDPERASGNLDWAEQHARQALLYDFTQGDAWRLLVDLKHRVDDEAGVHAVLEDLFTVLGRDPERAAQLRGVTLLPVASELLEAALLKDPLDADVWWNQLSEGDMPEDALADFATRCRRLDFTDARASVIFARRLIRVRRRDEDLFVDLSSHLLAHRPQNHELWLDLGRLHETRERYDEAWLCYDHVQTLRPHVDARDRFQARLNAALDGEERQPWSPPDVDTRQRFLSSMMDLRTRISPVIEAVSKPSEDAEEVTRDPRLVRIEALLDQGEHAEAFFLARRELASGTAWAQDVLDRARAGMEEMS